MIRGLLSQTEVKAGTLVIEGKWADSGDGLTRSVEMSTLHWYCFSLDMASSLWS